MVHPSDDPARLDPLLDRPAWAPAWAPTVDDVRQIRWLRWVTVAVFAAGLGACVLEGADGPADPELVTPTSGDAIVSDGSSPAVSDEPVIDEPVSDDVAALAATVGTITTELVDAAGEVQVLCLLHADTAAERGQGLMEVTDLSGVDGMLFARDDDTAGGFYMYRTRIELTVGWWDADGAYVGQADMVPCPSDVPGECPLYPPPATYRYGLEVAAGDPLARVFPDSTLRPGATGCGPGA